MISSLELITIGLRSLVSFRHGRRKNIIGLEFDQFGRCAGLRILPKQFQAGVNLLLHPVSIFRYFEFAYALQALPQTAQICLDVSSPRLFSMYAASKRPNMRIRITNPDRGDLATTQAIVSALGLRNITCEVSSVADLGESPSPPYDCIWSLSVVEHISGKYDDTLAVKKMYELLCPGGCLILTVPVDRTHWEEFRERNYYGTQKPESTGLYFFQRYYDEASIEKRLLHPIGQHGVSKKWFGERMRGHFAEYEAHWIRGGLRCTVDDPREITNHYQEYGSWRDMPGRGVCGIVITKED